MNMYVIHTHIYIYTYTIHRMSYLSLSYDGILFPLTNYMCIVLCSAGTGDLDGDRHGAKHLSPTRQRK